jgi:hypothetical protein
LRARGRTVAQRAVEIPLAIALGLGLSVSQTRAVWLGLFRRGGEFRRTPKKGERERSSYRPSLALPAGLELVLAAWLLFALGLAVQRGLWTPVPLYALFAVSFGWVGALSLHRSGAARALRAGRAPSAEARTAA